MFCLIISSSLQVVGDKVTHCYWVDNVLMLLWDRGLCLGNEGVINMAIFDFSLLVSFIVMSHIFKVLNLSENPIVNCHLASFNFTKSSQNLASGAKE